MNGIVPVGFSQSITNVLLDASAKSVLLLVVATIAASLAKKSSAAVRHRIWCLGFSSVLFLPLLCATLPGWKVAVLPASPPAPARPATGSGLADVTPAPAASKSAELVSGTSSVAEGAMSGSQSIRRELVPPATAEGAHADSSLPGPGHVPNSTASSRRTAALLATALVAVWIGGALLLLVPLLVGSTAVRFLLVRCRPVSDGQWTELLSELRGLLRLKRSVRLLQTDDAIVPVTWGVVRPVVLLPEIAHEWSPERRRCVLLHELAHVKRLDVPFQMIARLVCSLYWFNPLAWYALRRLRIERELACDDCVVAAGEMAVDYADQLVEIARAYRRSRLAVGIAMARTSNLEERVVALLDRTRSHRPVTKPMSGVISLTAVLLVSAAAAFKPVARAAETIDTKPDPATTIATSTGVASGAELVAKKVEINGAVRLSGVSLTATNAQPASGATILRGRVDGPKKEPIDGARLWVQKPQSDDWTNVARTDSHGEFHFDVAPLKRTVGLKKDAKRSIRVAATAKGLGFGWADLGDVTGDRHDLGPLRIRLVKDVPIEGRILTADGRPAAGVSAHVNAVRQPTKQTIDEYITAVRTKGAGFHSFKDGTWSRRIPGASLAVTDRDGRFTISGLGADRIALLSLKGSSIHNWWIVVVTRPVSDSEPDRKTNGALKLVEAPYDNHYYARFTHVSEPARTLRGVVRDRRTKEPMAGVEVKADFNTSVVATTGPDGRFELVGCRKDRRYKIEALTRSSRYFRREFWPYDRPGLDPLEVTVDMFKGVTVRGRVTDKATGRPVVGSVEYYPLFPNRFVKPLGDPAMPCSSSPIAKDGSYELQVLPGPGALGVRNYDAIYSVSQIDVRRAREVTGWDGSRDSGMVNSKEILFTQDGGVARGAISNVMFKALELIKPDEKRTDLEQNLVLVRTRDAGKTALDRKAKAVAGR